MFFLTCQLVGRFLAVLVMFLTLKNLHGVEETLFTVSTNQKPLSVRVQSGVRYCSIQWERTKFTVCVALVLDVEIALLSLEELFVFTMTNVFSHFVCGSRSLSIAINFNVPALRLAASVVCASVFRDHASTFQSILPSDRRQLQFVARQISFASCPTFGAPLGFQLFVHNAPHRAPARWAMPATLSVDFRNFSKSELKFRYNQRETTVQAYLFAW